MQNTVPDLRKIVYLSFPPESSGRPVVCNLTRLFDLTFNILKADISARYEGTMTLEISGNESDFHKGIGYLKENGVRITPVAQKVFRDDESCTHCGICTIMCPTKALSLERSTHLITFDIDSCSACGMCIDICPVKAIALDAD